MSTNPVNMNDYYRLASYAAGAQINHDPFSINNLQSELMFTGGIMALPVAFQAGKGIFWNGPKWLWQNRGNYTSAWKQVKANNAAAKASVEHLKGKNIFETINNRSYYDKITNAAKSLPSTGTKASYYAEAKRLIEEAKAKKLTGKALKDHLKKVDDAIAKADLNVHNAIKSGLIKPATKRGKVWAGIKKYSGYNAVDGALKKGAVSSNKTVRALSKGAKGGGLATAAIALAVETPEIVETYKECGAKKGTKQLAKTTAVVAAEGVGYAVGAKVGGIAGAKIGATIGTCIGGPVGTAIGGVVGGIIGVGTGVLCSWLAGKGMKSITGKSELQKHKEEEARRLAINAVTTKEGKQELIKKTDAKAQEDGGCSDQEIINTYTKIIDEKSTTTALSETNSESQINPEYSDLINSLSALAGGTVQPQTGNIFAQTQNIASFNPFIYGQI